jgi:hypothetical protein
MPHLSEKSEKGGRDRGTEGERRERERGIERKTTDLLFATASVVGIICNEAQLVRRGRR